MQGAAAACGVIAVNRMLPGEINLVISGINRWPNASNDIFASGTVSAALRGYLPGTPFLAISVNASESLHFDVTAKLAALLAFEVGHGLSPKKILLSANPSNLSS